MTLDPEQVAHWRKWIGRSETLTEQVEAESVRRYAAALGEPLDVERHWPSLGHWSLFLPVVAPDQLGPDGHPRRGGFMPPVALPRRMFAAGQIRFKVPLAIGRPATRTSTVADVVHKAGRSGDLVLVEVDHRIEQEGTLCIRERQTIVYRDADTATPAIVPQAAAPVDGGIMWMPGPPELFRFSAVTFNSHRIHYDLPYAATEGYPGLVVHGPFTAARLFGMAGPEARPYGFTFRAEAPLFAGQPILLQREVGGAVAAIRCDGVTAMHARIDYLDGTG